METVCHPSPNFGPRRDGLQPSLIVLHYTAMRDPEEALERLCAPEHEVSAHYLIHRDGRLFELVDEDMRAWHAGAGSWGGQGDVNSQSIGIEIDNDGCSPFSEPQLATLERLLPGVMERWGIPAARIIGHSDMAPDRKSDPGRRFPWSRLARQHLSVWSDRAVMDVDEAAFLKYAVTFGYPCDADINTLVDVLRQRFRPWATGPLDARDMGIIADLATRFPVDPIPPIA
ncbi:N-acetylmuramoyl-L-alanine amidase [Aliiroseovarius sp. 2305UL8-7]|uniref:N-acetylmuramoyl-L-alanine amidase n=1 Tax=Aliiroseovarius conchicola TaxID=3121637 RepID=UPI0035277E37